VTHDLTIAMWLFAKKKSPSEILRENKRMLDKSMRELDRERTSMMSQEKRLIAEIKKMAKANQMGAVKVRGMRSSVATVEGGARGED